MVNIYRMRCPESGNTDMIQSNLNVPDTALYEGRVAIRCLHMRLRGHSGQSWRRVVDHRKALRKRAGV
jgi:hypothetical protein